MSYVVLWYELSYSHGLNPGTGAPWAWRGVIASEDVAGHRRKMRRRFPGILIWLAPRQPA